MLPKDSTAGRRRCVMGRVTIRAFGVVLEDPATWGLTEGQIAAGTPGGSRRCMWPLPSTSRASWCHVRPVNAAGEIAVSRATSESDLQQ